MESGGPPIGPRGVVSSSQKTVKNCEKLTEVYSSHGKFMEGLRAAQKIDES